MRKTSNLTSYFGILWNYSWNYFLFAFIFKVRVSKLLVIQVLRKINIEIKFWTISCTGVGTRNIFLYIFWYLILGRSSTTTSNSSAEDNDDDSFTCSEYECDSTKGLDNGANEPMNFSKLMDIGPPTSRSASSNRR